jgi:hypothetical protein
VTITCTAKGGYHGGILNLTRSGFDKLLFVSGDQIPEESVTLAPNETRVWEGIYAPLTHSEAKDDISVTASFNEYVSGEFLLEEEKLTVVKLELEPWVLREGYKNRHIVGVREVIACKDIPNIGVWGCVRGVLIGTDYKTPLESDENTLFYQVDDFRFLFKLKIISPNIIVARNPQMIDFGIIENKSGGVGMESQIYILPETVSFSGISMEEIPSVDGIHEGYFSNSFFSRVWYHTEEMGAGDWTNIKPDNYWATDIAMMGEILPFETTNGDMTYDASMGNWRDGVITWYIQWGWGEFNSEQGDLPLGIIPKRYDQTFSINNEGTLSISKFGHIVSRGTNNVFYLNGTIVDKSNLIKKD